MTKKLKFFTYSLAIAGVFLLLTSSCKKKDKNHPAGAVFTDGGGVTDIDGNQYKTVILGTQEWMAENLKVTKYRNGEAILNKTDAAEWGNLPTGAYCVYDNTPNSTYGMLYNWHAVDDSRKLAPAGWHVASDAEWTTLSTYLGGENEAGGKLKETGTTHWNSPNTGATNVSGFTALPGGYRSYDGTFYFMGGSGYWWTSTFSHTNFSWYTSLYNDGKDLSRNDYRVKEYGFSVRCVKD